MQQNESFELPDDLNDFAKRLTSFKAHSLVPDRDQMLFLAGQATARAELLADATSVRRSLRVWQTAALVLLTFSLGLGTSLALSSGRPLQVVIADRDRSIVVPGAVPVSPTGSHSTTESTAVASRPGQEEQGAARSLTAAPATLDRNVIEGLQTRLALIERMIEGDSPPDFVATNPKQAIEFAQRRHPDVVLSHRSLLRGDGSHILINRLIEEPNL